MPHTTSHAYVLLTGISAIFMGMNCILFFFCVYVLWAPKSKSRKLLLLSTILQFLLCFVQIILFMSYVVTALSLVPGASDEPHLRRLSGFSLVSYIIYIINSCIQESLLIWRVLLLYNYNIIFCIPLVILLFLQMALSGVTAKGFATETLVVGRLRAFHLATWALIAATNVLATILICVRLWIANKNMHAILSRSKYKSTIIVVVECGCLVTVCSILMLIMYSMKIPLTLACVGISTQIATLAPLLIIARHGMLNHQDDRIRSLASQSPVHICVVRTEYTPTGRPRESCGSKFLSDPSSDLPDGTRLGAAGDMQDPVV